MESPRRVLFLPGASGTGDFWRPVAERLPDSWQKVLFDWPGLGDVPAVPHVRSYDDLARLVMDELHAPADLVAQSMGGVVAINVALARPEAVRRLVLVATSGGVDLSGFDVADWRAEYRVDYPRALPFVTDEQHADLSRELARVTAPTLLLWAAADTISPPAVGRALAARLTLAQPRLVVLDQGDHAFAREYPERVAPLIERHLSMATS